MCVYACQLTFVYGRFHLQLELSNENSNWNRVACKSRLDLMCSSLVFGTSMSAEVKSVV